MPTRQLLSFLSLFGSRPPTSSFLPRERQYYLWGGGVPLHPYVSYLTEQYKARPVGEPFPVTWYSFLNIPAGGSGLEGHRNSGLPETSVTLTAGNRRAGSQSPTGGEGLRGRPQLGQVLHHPLSAPPRAPDPNHRGPASGTPECGRGQLPGRVPGGPRGLSVCVTYVTESPDANLRQPPACSTEKGWRVLAAAQPRPRIRSEEGRAGRTFRPRPLVPTRRLRVALAELHADGHVRLRSDVGVAQATDRLSLKGWDAEPVTSARTRS